MRDASDSWQNAAVSDLCTLLNGLAFKPEDWTKGGLPIIRIQNLNGSTDFNLYDGPVPDPYVVHAGTLLFSWSGNRGTSFGPYRWPGPTGILNQHIFKVTPKADVEVGWLYYALDVARDLAERTAHGGSGLVHVRRGDLLGYRIPTPSRTEQRRIASILDTIDDAIHKTEKIIAKLKQVKQGLLHDLLTRGIDDNGELRDPERHPEQFKDSALGRIPRGWAVLPVGECCTSIVPGRDKPDLDGGSLPWITVTDIDGLYVECSRLGLSLSPRALRAARGRTIPQGAVVMSCVGDFGFAAVAQREMVVNQQLHGFVCDNTIMPAWLAHFLIRQGPYMGIVATQTTIKYMNKASCESVPVAVPPLDEQQSLVNRLSAIDGKVELELQSRDKLRLLKQGLMEDLLTGRVRVTPLLEGTTP